MHGKLVTVERRGSGDESSTTTFGVSVRKTSQRFLLDRLHFALAMYPRWFVQLGCL